MLFTSALFESLPPNVRKAIFEHFKAVYLYDKKRRHTTTRMRVPSTQKAVADTQTVNS